jgi:hypothetical protein
MSDQWVTDFASEEHRREQVRTSEAAVLSRRNEATQFHLRTLMDLLHDRVARDIDAFAREFPDRRVAFEDDPSGCGFVVRRESYPEGRIRIEPAVSDASIKVEYFFASSSGTSSPKLLELVVDGHHTGELHFKDDKAQRAFRGIDQLSEYLLVPIFRGRPR